MSKAAQTPLATHTLRTSDIYRKTSVFFGAQTPWPSLQTDVCSFLLFFTTPKTTSDRCLIFYFLLFYSQWFSLQCISENDPHRRFSKNSFFIEKKMLFDFRTFEIKTFRLNGNFLGFFNKNHTNCTFFIQNSTSNQINDLLM